MQAVSRWFLRGVPTYVIVTLIGLRARHRVALFALLALFYVFESSVFTRKKTA